ncbi:unnamed protein product [Heligmosomoides polygyrus]|uniref:Clan AA aspartic protease n=1 Tax=Heligmosomoides polygyrus TaxID=6339 RepID=A0A183GHJ0_HELPZ|nr:unnamed protein product [Heligmosomoides polygyrus]
MAQRSEHKENQTVGKLLRKNVKLLGLTKPALIDSGSMVSLISVDVLEEALSNGFDVDVLPTLTRKEIGPIFDASGNAMEVFGAVTIEVELEGGLKDNVTFHIIKQSDEILVGMNALERLGVRITISSTDARNRNREDPR